MPLTPADCDLRDFPFMQIDIVRLFGSEFHALATDAAWRAGVTLWLKAWHQVPAGSLPDDDAQLARLAELGRDTKGFRKLKDQALRGWILCDDGRLYHRVVAEKVLEAWLEKLAQRLSSGAGNAKRWKVAFDPTDIEAQIATAIGMLKHIAPQSRRIPKALRRRSQRDPDGTPDRIPSGSQEIGIGIGRYSVTDVTGAAAAPPSDPPDVAKAADAHLWDAGKRFLQTRGVSKAQSGSVIGKWKGTHGTAPVIEALGIAQREPDLVDPIPFIEKILRRRWGNDGDGSNMIGGVRLSSPC